MITRKEEEMRVTIKIDQELLQKLYEFKTTRAIEVACEPLKEMWTAGGKNERPNR